MTQRINSLGQSLLEVAMAVGVVIVVVTALTTVTLNGLRNSQFAQNQSQATKLAQDALEKVRTIRDREGMVNSSATTWSGFFPVNCAISDCYFQLGVQTTDGSSCTNTVPLPTNTPSCLKSYGSFLLASEQLLNKFTRTIQIHYSNISSPCAADQKKVMVTVSWQDASGKHQSYLETILGKIGC